MFCCIIPRDDRFVFRCLVGLQVLLICWTYSWLGAADWTGWWLVLIDGMFGSLQSHLLVFCMVLYELSVQYMFVKWWYRSISWQWSGVHISFLLAMWVCWMFIKVTIFTIWWWPQIFMACLLVFPAAYITLDTMLYFGTSSSLEKVFEAYWSVIWKVGDLWNQSCW